MEKPQYHILVCSSARASGELKGVCHKKGASDLPQYLENEILDRGIDALVSTTSCFKVCNKGPVLTVYPNGWWYGEIDEEKIDEILDSLEEDKPAEALLMA
ncbi:Ferredoxin, 2Fe-2S [Novipirellula aureliae]|uniref:Ferredoxin, 2Fe-2S n=1 Tax=Novipirellula aureliae TaxID=2527966 RepID=A0A5C6E8J1_9BACT|nr:(2Fe-2S) ferredoxin domain-containing protein [Novipirellula aureliae]TWU45150.1 Ferredoxin, 2Fe-2S [Novipirellula aureliae]